MGAPAARPTPIAPTTSTAGVLSQAGSENFPVASRVLPAALRPHLLAIYGFARMVDDIGDEADGDRSAQLAWVEDELDRAAEGQATHPVLVSLSPTLARFDLSLEPFQALIEANRQDQVVTRYRSFEDLRAYCMLSAAPVGRLVLTVLGAATPDRIRRSDEVCIGLQLVEHLQDVAEDAEAGRIYLPTEDLADFGCPPEGLTLEAHRPALRAVVAFEVRRARGLLAAGGPLAASLPGRLRLAVAAFSAGGAAALDAIERASYDVVAHRCRPARGRLLRHWFTTVVAPSRRGRW